MYALTQQETEYKNLQGQYLKPITFKNIDGARKFRREVVTQNSPIYGLERYHYQYIGKEFPKNIEWSKEFIKIFTLDIECGCENGFPDVENPIEELLCITVKIKLTNRLLLGA